MHIHAGLKPTIETGCAVGPFTPVISVDAMSELTGWSAHMICQWAAAQGVKLHQCCGIDYLPGSLLVRHLAQWSNNGQDAEELVTRASHGIVNLLAKRGHADTARKLSVTIRESMALATALNEKEIGARVDISGALRTAFQPQYAGATKPDSGE